ncbi:transposase [Thorsellia kenyensis]|uniref:Transposase n=1 Tax=Thorsellia kenyensis TaxID=1549888 RepID=A0ABV6C701_9GAMM
MANPKFSDEFKMNAIKLANNRGDRSLKDVAKELNICLSALYFIIISQVKNGHFLTSLYIDS